MLSDSSLPNDTDTDTDTNTNTENESFIENDYKIDLQKQSNNQLSIRNESSASPIIRKKRKRPRLRSQAQIEATPKSPLSNTIKVIPIGLMLHNKIIKLRGFLRKEMEVLSKIKEIHSLNLTNTLFITQQFRHLFKTKVIEVRDDLMMRIALMISDRQTSEEEISLDKLNEVQSIRDELSLLKIEHSNVQSSLESEKIERQKAEKYHLICQEDWEKMRIVLERKLKKTSSALKELQGTPKLCHNCSLLCAEIENLTQLVKNSQNTFIDDLQTLKELKIEKNLSEECQDLRTKLLESQGETGLLMERLSSTKTEISSLEDSFNTRLDSNLNEILSLKQEISSMKEDERNTATRMQRFRTKLMELLSIQSSIENNFANETKEDEAIFSRLQELKESKKELKIKMEMEKMREKYEKEKRLLQLRIEDLQEENGL